MSEEYLTPNDLAKRYKLSLRTIRKHVYNRRFPGGLKIGGQWRFRKNAIDKAEASGDLLLPAAG
jgi:excisionase family DNA binding protein